MLFRLMRTLDLCSIFFIFVFFCSIHMMYICSQRLWCDNSGSSILIWASIYLSELILSLLCVCVFFYFSAPFQMFPFYFVSIVLNDGKAVSFFYFVTSRRSPQIHMMDLNPTRLNQVFSDWHICILFNDDNLIVHIFASFFFFFMRGLTRYKLQRAVRWHSMWQQKLNLLFFWFINIANEFLFVPVR